MKKVSLFSRVLAGMLLVGAGSLAFMGCGDVTVAPNEQATLEVRTVIPTPTAPTAATYTEAAVVPAVQTPATDVTLNPIAIVAPQAQITATGANPTLAVNIGNDETVEGTLPIVTTTTGGVEAGNIAVLPVGTSSIALGAGTQLNINQLFGQAAASRQATEGNLIVKKFTLLFDVNPGRTWTLPSSFRLNLEKRENDYVLNGSYLTLSWGTAGSVAPLDRQARVTLELSNNGTQVFSGTSNETITNNTATFESFLNRRFDAIDNLVIDLRNAK